MDQMLDAGFCLPATCPLVPIRLAMLGKRAGLAWQAGWLRLQARRAGIFDYKRKLSLFTQHQVSSILPIVASMIVFTMLSFLVPACPGYGFKYILHKMQLDVKIRAI
jgi:hypothetical protein